MNHKVPLSQIEPLIAGPSATKTNQVANVQNFIQGLLGETHHTFLQGSYRNHTAIADINDVDIVAVRKTTYSSVHSGHGPFETSISWGIIFNEIENKLKSQNTYSNWNVERGDKCITIRGDFDIDVVPAVKIDHDHTSDPVAIYSHKNDREKQNFPKTFYNNGVLKNDRTNENYKPTVRMFKNWVRNHFDDNDIISSFKIQSLVYSAKDEDFYDDMVANFILVGTHIRDILKKRQSLPIKIISVCETEDISDGWDSSKRQAVIDQLEKSLSFAHLAYDAQSIAEAENYWKKAFNL
jgi:hypothetical protein